MLDSVHEVFIRIPRRMECSILLITFHFKNNNEDVDGLGCLDLFSVQGRPNIVSVLDGWRSAGEPTAPGLGLLSFFILFYHMFRLLIYHGTTSRWREEKKSSLGRMIFFCSFSPSIQLIYQSVGSELTVNKKPLFYED